jgi:hypothetical protein
MYPVCFLLFSDTITYHSTSWPVFLSPWFPLDREHMKQGLYSTGHLSHWPFIPHEHTSVDQFLAPPATK